mmetsp:Transcript_9444/g.27899  ORF Transcript_9444/g.27899 Transcript_9444/m.27899 type:complete len:278 (-) Transcript_9444:26-859(-)
MEAAIAAAAASSTPFALSRKPAVSPSAERKCCACCCIATASWAGSDTCCSTERSCCSRAAFAPRTCSSFASAASRSRVRSASFLLATLKQAYEAAAAHSASPGAGRLHSMPSSAGRKSSTKSASPAMQAKKFPCSRSCWTRAGFQSKLPSVSVTSTSMISPLSSVLDEPASIALPSTTSISTVLAVDWAATTLDCFVCTSCWETPSASGSSLLGGFETLFPLPSAIPAGRLGGTPSAAGAASWGPSRSSGLTRHGKGGDTGLGRGGAGAWLLWVGRT